MGRRVKGEWSQANWLEGFAEGRFVSWMIHWLAGGRYMRESMRADGWTREQAGG